jgi:hypothetical protein
VLYVWLVDPTVPSLDSPHCVSFLPPPASVPLFPRVCCVSTLSIMSTTMTMTAESVVESINNNPHSSHVPLACFGNGRNQKQPRNNKIIRSPDLFLPSEALEQFMKNKPEVRNLYTYSILALNCYVRWAFKLFGILIDVNGRAYAFLQSTHLSHLMHFSSWLLDSYFFSMYNRLSKLAGDLH